MGPAEAKVSWTGPAEAQVSWTGPAWAKVSWTGPAEAMVSWTGPTFGGALEALVGARVVLTFVGARVALTLVGARVALTLVGARVALTLVGARVALTLVGALECWTEPAGKLEGAGGTRGKRNNGNLMTEHRDTQPHRRVDGQRLRENSGLMNT